MNKIEIYDTTLRDGAQGEAISFTLNDKLRIAEKLDEFGIDFIEGGWPGSNPKDITFFKRARNKKFKNVKIVAFGSTRRKNFTADKDPFLKQLLDSETEYITVFGKSWDLHVTDVLKTSLDENLKLIEDSIKFLRSEGRKVFFDAEHFFDGYKKNPDYALKTIKVAVDAGANKVVLCDTNGGSLQFEIEEIVKIVSEQINVPLGIHTHNDSGLAVANTIAAVRAGAEHIQGTINGVGERCGNADLSVIIPILQLKMGYRCVAEDKMSRITEVSRFIYEVANIVPPNSQPFVGMSAFAHKGGVHIDAVNKNPETYEHIDPAKVGNERRILLSELSGKSTILHKAKKYNLDKNPEIIKKILDRIMNLENDGYQFEAADGSFDIIVKKALGEYKKLFTVEGFRVIVEKRGKKVVSEATVKIRVGRCVEHTASEGNGPVNALDSAMRKALVKFYPEIDKVKLTDYKVRILHPEKATAAVTRVIIESTDESETWGTIGVSENIIEASLMAMLDSIDYKLHKTRSKT
ncbi:MAG: citramalate synthase [Candidatus Ratteibacteria bacterium]|nr:citramalate synthase [Candidatus Ratteibacteria bacterium]